MTRVCTFPLAVVLIQLLCLSAWLGVTVAKTGRPSRLAFVPVLPNHKSQTRKETIPKSVICRSSLWNTSPQVTRESSANRQSPVTQGCFFTPGFELTKLRSSPNNEDPNNEEQLPSKEEAELDTRRKKLRKRVRSLAQKMMSTASAPKAIASVLRDATMGAVDMAVEEVLSRRPTKHSDDAAHMDATRHATTNATLTVTGRPAVSTEANKILSELTMDLVEEAFEPVERSLEEMETSLDHARTALSTAKSQASHAIEAIQAAAIAQAEGAATIVQAAEEEAERKVINEIYDATSDVDVASLTFEDVDYEASEMAPPFLDEAQCLIPGEPVVRVEKAPENSRRIFAGIDIMASVDDVWTVLTDYENLHNVVPNLVVNEVLERYEGRADYNKIEINTGQSGQDQCREMAQQMKGSLLKQVGGAKVGGINFSARTTLEVREWPQGLPDFAYYQDEVHQGKSRDARAKEYTQMKLERYKFPRPFAISSLPTKDISMQNIPTDDGEFRLYQGVWRMQPLPGCAAPGKSAMRLTYAVEISPRAYLPVHFVEGRIVKDLCNNLVAIRDVVAAMTSEEEGQPVTI